jgi:hypothetical protein
MRWRQASAAVCQPSLDALLEGLSHHFERLVHGMDTPAPRGSDRTGLLTAAVKTPNELLLSGRKLLDTGVQGTLSVGKRRMIVGDAVAQLISQGCQKGVTEHMSVAAAGPPVHKNLMSCHTQGPGEKGFFSVKRGKTPPQDEARFLKKIVRIDRVGNERPDKRLNPALFSGIEPEKSLIDSFLRFVMRARSLAEGTTVHMLPFSSYCAVPRENRTTGRKGMDSASHSDVPPLGLLTRA